MSVSARFDFVKDEMWIIKTDRIIWTETRGCWDLLSQQSAKYQSDPSSNCFKIDVWKINCCMQQFIFLLSYCYLYLILHKFWSVLICDILGIGFFRFNIKWEDETITQKTVQACFMVTDKYMPTCIGYTDRDGPRLCTLSCKCSNFHLGFWGTVLWTVGGAGWLWNT